MEQVYYALTDTVIPWIEDRFGEVAAWVAAVGLIVLPIAGTGVIVLLLTRG